MQPANALKYKQDVLQTGCSQKHPARGHPPSCLTPSCGQLETTVLPPVDVAVATEATVFVGGAPLVPAIGRHREAALAGLLPVGGRGRVHPRGGKGGRDGARGGCLAWKRRETELLEHSNH